MGEMEALRCYLRRPSHGPPPWASDLGYMGWERHFKVHAVDDLALGHCSQIFDQIVNMRTILSCFTGSQKTP